MMLTNVQRPKILACPVEHIEGHWLLVGDGGVQDAVPHAVDGFGPGVIRCPTPTVQCKPPVGDPMAFHP